MSDPAVSIVIPAFDEAHRIVASLVDIDAFLRAHSPGWEVWVVDDGSGDDTAALAERFAADHPGFHVLRVRHGGKGAALRAGVEASRGAYLLICDADLAVPIQQASRLLPETLGEFDLAIGSREAPGAARIGEPWSRHWMGRVFNAWVRLVAVRGISDTQCGFKCFRAHVARELFALQRLGGWAFDVELLFLARQRGYVVREVGVEWHYREGSKVSPLRDARAMFWDVLRVRWNQLRGRYRPGAALARSEGGVAAH